MNVIALLGVILLLAVLLERLVEAVVGPLFDHIPPLIPYKWTQFYVAVLLGILGGVLYKFDVIYLLSVYTGAGLSQTYYGYIITGAAIGSGSALIHDIITKFFPGAGATNGKPSTGIG